MFCKFPTVNISERHFWLVICIAKNFIWTTLKVIFSIFIFFLHPQIPDFQIVVSQTNMVLFVPILKKMTLMSHGFYFRFTFFHGGTLIYKWNAKCTLIWKEDFGALSNSPVLLLRSPGKMLLTMFLFQKWIVALFLKMSERDDSWCTDSSFSSLLVKLSQVFESALLDSILKLAVITVAFAHFPSQFLPSSQLCI